MTAEEPQKAVALGRIKAFKWPCYIPASGDSAQHISAFFGESDNTMFAGVVRELVDKGAITIGAPQPDREDADPRLQRRSAKFVRECRLNVSD